MDRSVGTGLLPPGDSGSLAGKCAVPQSWLGPAPESRRPPSVLTGSLDLVFPGLIVPLLGHSLALVPLLGHSLALLPLLGHSLALVPLHGHSNLCRGLLLHLLGKRPQIFLGEYSMQLRHIFLALGQRARTCRCYHASHHAIWEGP